MEEQQQQEQQENGGVTALKCSAVGLRLRLPSANLRLRPDARYQ